RELAHALQEAVVFRRSGERLRPLAGAVHRQVHGQAVHLRERQVLLVKRLAREHVFAFADEYLVRESRLRGQPRGVDPPGAVEEGAFYAEHLFAKAGAGRLTEPIVETRVTDGGGIHRRELELAIEPL